ncbi:MAG: YheC/YheD family protein [Firmicutes bacterium]|uniref:YheC/D like ATP-grasp n=1 Tax=Melghirimyces thermohalophilus TaxID=1236220 RepID=A0A1G6IA31_9BACL|nr:YheC/YheD family protein [Melghirimyces thermohalophilus]MDA8351628.1 YheC/YheD family protein [Bacillota bacterium]SDC02606.1 YheC/D like ATP-grasp [Melghirimyces thermohalophilus]
MAKKGYKYRVHQKLMKDPVLAKSLPETWWLDKENLLTMLDRHGGVIVKPSGGTGGYGIIQVKQVGMNTYEIHRGTRRQSASRKAVYDRVRSMTGHRTLYMVQQRIPLMAVGGRPVDVRVMVQRRRQTPWRVTGHLAKVAGKGHVVTNVARSKGYVLTVAQAVRHSDIHSASAEEVIRKLNDFCLRAAWQLGGVIVGFDMGVDKSGNVWMIEANPKPALSLFKRLKDPSMYRQIVSYPRPY